MKYLVANAVENASRKRQSGQVRTYKGSTGAFLLKKQAHGWSLAGNSWKSSRVTGPASSPMPCMKNILLYSTSMHAVDSAVHKTSLLVLASVVKQKRNGRFVFSVGEKIQVLELFSPPCNTYTHQKEFPFNTYSFHTSKRRTARPCRHILARRIGVSSSGYYYCGSLSILLLRRMACL